MLEVIGSILSRVSGAKKYCGIHCASMVYGMGMLAQGANFITVGSDLRFVTSAAGAIVTEFRKSNE